MNLVKLDGFKMAKRIKGVTLKRQQNWFDNHRQSYEDQNRVYEPFWRCEDIRSSGIKSKIVHFKTANRLLHLLSFNELWMYLHLARNAQVIEVYEQFAIPLEDSLMIAKELDVRHPVYVGTNIPAVQTIDFVVDMLDVEAGKIIQKAFPVKQPEDAKKFRTAEKLAIQEGYAAIKGMDHELITSESLRTNLSVNLEVLYRYRNLPVILNKVASRFRNNFYGAIHDDRHEKTANLIELASNNTGIDYNTGVQFFYHGLWNKHIDMDWNHLLRLEMAASDLGICPNE